MSIDFITTNMALVVPGDDTKNTPWGQSVHRCADALKSLDAQIPAAMQGQTFNYAADTGIANAYAAAYTPAPVLNAGLGLYFKAVHANTAASTLAVNGGTAKAITKNGATALSGSEISAGQIVHVVYDGTQFQMVSI